MPSPAGSCCQPGPGVRAAGRHSAHAGCPPGSKAWGLRPTGRSELCSGAWRQGAGPRRGVTGAEGMVGVWIRTGQWMRDMSGREVPMDAGEGGHSALAMLMWDLVAAIWGLPLLGTELELSKDLRRWQTGCPQRHWRVFVLSISSSGTWQVCVADLCTLTCAWRVFVLSHEHSQHLRCAWLTYAL